MDFFVSRLSKINLHHNENHYTTTPLSCRAVARVNKTRAMARVTQKMTRKMMTRVTKFLSGRAAGSFFGRPGSFTGDPNKWRHSLFWKKFAEYDRFTAHSILLFSLGVSTRLPHHTMTPHEHEHDTIFKNLIHA